MAPPTYRCAEPFLSFQTFEEKKEILISISTVCLIEIMHKNLRMILNRGDFFFCFCLIRYGSSSQECDLCDLPSNTENPILEFSGCDQRSKLYIYTDLLKKSLNRLTGVVFLDDTD